MRNSRCNFPFILWSKKEKNIPWNKEDWLGEVWGSQPKEFLFNAIPWFKGESTKSWKLNNFHKIDKQISRNMIS